MANTEVEKQRASFTCRLLLQDREAREFALRCCEILSAFEENSVLELLTSENTIQLLVSLTESDQSERDPETDTRVVQILANLVSSNSDIIMQKLLYYGAIDIFSVFLETGTKQCQQYSLFALSNLACHSEAIAKTLIEHPVCV